MSQTFHCQLLCGLREQAVFLASCFKFARTTRQVTLSHLHGIAGRGQVPGAATLDSYPTITTALCDLGLEPVSLRAGCLTGLL